MKLTIPDLSLVVLIGPSGAGKSTFARKHFLPTEVISSDFCRGLISDDENNQLVTTEAFEVLRYIAAKRLAAGKLTVIDATSVQPESRKPLVTLAREYHCLPVAIAFNLPEKVCQERNRGRPDRDFGAHVIRNHLNDLRRGLHGLGKEGFRHVFVLNSVDEVEEATIERQRLYNNKMDQHGPFDIIGDIHGCYDELSALLDRLGYEVVQDTDGQRRHPAGRRVVFLGDLVDRGPNIPGVLKQVMTMVADGSALCVPGNHEKKLLRALQGKQVSITHGLAESLEQIGKEPPEFKTQVMSFMDKLVSHYVLDDGNLVVAHAGMKESMQGRGSGGVREFALYGETTGETDEFGLPVRYNWAGDYRGKAMVVYGHTPVAESEWLNRTICVDNGCVFGGKLTALRYPEKELVSIPAHHTYYTPAKPFLPDDMPQAPQRPEDVLDLEDVVGKRVIETKLHRKITIREENANAALEVMSRFALNPKWLIYLPPTMSPSETSKEPGLLEHPADAFDYYRRNGVERVVCEQKHMGSRAVVIVCRDEEVVQKRFGITGEGFGACYTRAGRRFFEDRALEAQFLTRVRTALDAANYWDEFETDWICLDCELMPWSAKAQSLLREQYAAVGSAARAALPDTLTTLSAAVARGLDVGPLTERYGSRLKLVEQYVTAYRQYCWPTHGIADYKLAPFHILATEGAVHATQDHVWHMDTLAKLCQADPELLLATPYKVVDVNDPTDEAAGIAWWEELTGRGGEGIVVKPYDFIARHKGTILQPAVKCRGPEYLRIIYGPEYTMPEHLARLRKRGVGAKRSLALREFALGIESLDRFVAREPLYHIHECVFGVMALESEPVDPRL